MTLPTGASPTETHSVGKPEDYAISGEEFVVLQKFLALSPPREFMRYCIGCDYRTCFRAEFELANGLYGVCTACGDWSVVPYTRTVES
jgi:hypothetical protein